MAKYSQNLLNTSISVIMGAKISRDDFHWVYTDQPHGDRRKAMFSKYTKFSTLCVNFTGGLKLCDGLFSILDKNIEGSIENNMQLHVSKVD